PPSNDASARSRQLWRRQLRGDLDNIVLKAMHEDPNRRYQSAAQLADDLKRWRAGRPVLAQRDTFNYRARKFVRRNRAGVLAASLTALPLLAGIIATSWQARAANLERDRTALEAKRAQTINTVLTETLASADPVNDGRDVRVADVLDRASATIDRTFADHPVVLADLHDTLGRTYWSLGLYQAAADHHRAAVRLRTENLGPEHPLTLRAINEYATAQQDLGHLEEAEALFRQNLELR